MSRVIAVAALCLLASACGDTRLRPVAWRVATDAEALDFGTAYVGAASERRLVLANDSRATLTLRVQVEAGVFEAPEAVTLTPGEQREVAVRFVPAAAGLVATDLVVTGGDEALHVTLQGEGLAPGTCAPVSACAAERFDPASGRCVRSVAADGTACAETCLSGATCQAGECVGLARACDDGNACTRDACGARGCVHVPVVLPEAPADRPCQVAACDPRRGVHWVDREDGSACGEATCGSARVCMAGACVQRAQPLGLCGRGCGGTELRCEDNACVAQDGALAPAWRYVPAEGSTLHLLDVVDADGNVYWFEGRREPESRCELVSADRAGRLRYRQPIASFYECQYLHKVPYLLHDGHLVFALTSRLFQWRRLSDGALDWAPDLRSALEDRGVPVRESGHWVQSLVGPAGGAVFAMVKDGQQLELGYSALVRLDRARREARVTHVYPADRYAHGPLVADTSGRLFAPAPTRGQYSDPWGGQSYLPDGTPDWYQLQGMYPLAAWDGWLWASGRIFDAGTGVLRVNHGQVTSAPVGSGARAFAYVTEAGCRGPGCPAERRDGVFVLTGVDLRTGQVDWHARLPVRNLLLAHTSDGGVLAPTALLDATYTNPDWPSSGATRMEVEGGLARVAGDGRVLQRRTFCEPEVLQSFTLHRGRVVGSALRVTPRDGLLYLGTPHVVAYDVPGLPALASHGWVTQRGDAGGTRAPR